MPDVEFHIHLGSAAVTLVDGGIAKYHTFTLIIDNYEDPPASFGLTHSEVQILGHLLLAAEPHGATINGSLRRALASLPLSDEDEKVETEVRAMAGDESPRERRRRKRGQRSR